MTADSANEFADFRRTFEDSLSAYGQDFAMRGAKPGEQRWGDPVLGLAVAGTALWVAKVAIEALIKAVVAGGVEQKVGSRELKDLLDRVHTLETNFAELANGQVSVRDGLEVLDRDVAGALAELRGRVEGLQHLDTETASLQAVFMQLGLTPRRAERAASDIGPRLVQFLIRKPRP